MVEGRLGKFFEEICLLDQAFVKNPDMKVRQFVESKGATLKDSFATLLVKVSKNAKTTLLKK
ncbi:hypothetical protein ACT7DH_28755 [Bacillus pacificus]